MLKILLFLVIFLSSEYLYSQSDDSDWTNINLQSGDFPGCNSFVTPGYDYSLNNYLSVYLGGSTDLVLKLIDTKTEKCIRYVFIKNGDTYYIKNVPQGTYYLKLSFGNNWSKIGSGTLCFAKFKDNVLYQKGEEILDFNIIKYPNGYEIPSFSLHLEVISNNRNNEFQSEEISEEEFYK